MVVFSKKNIRAPKKNINQTFWSTLVHSLFEEQVKKTPNTLAIISADHKLTYQQINAEANKLAHHLINIGVKREDIIAVAMERSPEFIIGILGILKAGAAYAPIDLSTPKQRVEFILNDTSSPIFLTEAIFNKRFKTFNQHIISLFLEPKKSTLSIHEKKFKEHIFQDHQTLPDYTDYALNPSLKLSPNNLAYVIYTSGSTGTPKGVCIEHRSLSNYLCHIRNHCSFSSGDSFLHSSIAFDMSLTSLFLTLIKGNTLWIVPDGENPLESLMHSIQLQTNLNVLKLTPSHLKSFKGLVNLRKSFSPQGSLFLGGELLLWKDLDAFFAPSDFSKFFIFNHYGPTEACVGCCILRVSPQMERYSSTVPIGKPISNTKAYLLDKDMNPVSLNEIGELYISGVGLARGYLNQPGLTAEKFIPNPFVKNSKNPIEKSIFLRLYRTGDLGRLLPDKTIELVGRTDDQIKIKGYRIECGEIESILNKHPKVISSTVFAWDDSSGINRLVAYIIPLIQNHDAKITKMSFSDNNIISIFSGSYLDVLDNTLRHYLKKILPAYMVPSFLIFMDTFPLTPNGKIAKKEISAYLSVTRNKKPILKSSSTEIEKILTSVWCSTFNLSSIERNTNFFNLGGDSIISMQLTAQARARGITFSALDVLKYPTIRSLSRVAKKMPDSLIIPQTRFSTEHEFFSLTPIQRWFFSRSLKNPHHYNQAVFLDLCFQYKELFLYKAFEEIISRHDIFKCYYQKNKDGIWEQKFRKTADKNFFYTIVDLSHLPHHARKNQISQMTKFFQSDLNIKSGPLISVIIFKLGEKNSDRLLIIIHHLLIDGVSWRIILEELAQIYQNIATNQVQSSLPTTLSYDQWAHSLSNYATSEELKNEALYWQNIERNIVPLETDFNKGPNTNCNAHEFRISLAEEETIVLLTKVNSTYKTQINDLLLTALTLGIGDWGKDYNLSIALEGHGREEIIPDIDVSRTVGWFTSIYPVNLTIRDPNDLQSAILSIKKTLSSLPKKGIGYGVIAFLNQKANLTQPIPSLSFNYLGQWDNLSSINSLFHLSSDVPSFCVDPVNIWPTLLSIDVEIRHGRLCFFWSFSKNHYYKKTIITLANNCMKRLQQLIRHCSQTKNSPSLVPNLLPLPRFQKHLAPNSKGLSSIGSTYPLSPMQLGFLFHTLYAPHSDAYIVQTILVLEGDLNVVSMEQAWQHLCDHYDTLRTGFLWETLESPLQHVVESCTVAFTYLNWTSETASIKTKLEKFLKSDRNNGFDLKKPPLFRIWLIQTAPKTYHLIWTKHHIIGDGWSAAILLENLFHYYQLITKNRTLKLPEETSYQKYVSWLKKKNLQNEKSFWQKRLSPIKEPTRFSFKSLCKKNPYKDYDTFFLELSEQETYFLKQCAKNHKLSLNTLLQGTAALLIKHFTHQNNFFMGMTFSGRTIDLPGITNMVGLFMSTLPLAVSFSPGEGFFSFLKKLQRQIQDLHNHTHVPLSDIKTWSGHGTDLFDLLFVYEKYPKNIIDINMPEGINIRSTYRKEKTHYPLTLIAEEGDRILFNFSYQTEHFNKKIILNLVHHFQNLLKNIIETEFSKNLKLPSYWLPNNSQRPWFFKSKYSLKTNPINSYPEIFINPAVLFEKQASLHGKSKALIYKESTWSYDDLNKKANQLGHYLKTLGVGPETLVSIACKNPLFMVLGLLGILKAGGVYVPLNPLHPKSRIKNLLEQMEFPIFLADDFLKSTFKDYPGKSILLDKKSPFFQQQSQENFPSPSQEKHLAYIIYTSGSTGDSKGVLCEHISLRNLLNSLSSTLSIEPGEYFLQNVSFSFDPSLWTILWPLVNGATLVLMDPESIADPKFILETIKKYSIQTLHAGPSLMRNIMSQKELSKENQIDTIRHIIGGGEPWLPQDIKRIMKMFPQCTFTNVYGPTETTIHVTQWSYRQQSPNFSLKTVPIGNPIDNVQIYILDENQNIMPPLAPGELHVAGISLARGYHNDPSLTGERFIPNPFFSKKDSAHHNSSRLYKTGDLARFLLDGTIEFLGRMDNQVKIRGYRIEPGEVMSHLNANPFVENSAVFISKNSQGDKVLFAYIVPTPKKATEFEKGPFFYSAAQEKIFTFQGRLVSLAIEDMRTFLSEKIPDYMIPSVFCFLDVIPLTSQGKLDTKNYPAKLIPQQTNHDRITHPTNYLQFLLLELWTKILEIENISLDDNFFKLGGNSLTAMRLVNELQQVIHKDLYVTDIFSHPTVFSLSRHIENLSNSYKSKTLFPIQKKGKNPPLVLLPPLGGLSFCYLGLSKFITQYPIFGFNNPRFGNSTSPYSSVHEMAKDYSLEITSLLESQLTIGGWSFGGFVAFELACLLQKIQKPIQKLILIDSIFEKETSSPLSKQTTKTNLFVKHKFLKDQRIDLESREGKSVLFELEHNEKLANSYRPTETFVGTVHIIARCKDLQQFWQPYVDGLIITHPIPSQHREMFDPGSVELTAKLIKKILSSPA